MSYIIILIETKLFSDLYLAKFLNSKTVLFTCGIRLRIILLGSRKSQIYIAVQSRSIRLC